MTNTNQRYILWADDDKDDLAILHTVLDDIGRTYAIEEVGNGQEALDHLERAKHRNRLPSLIILDMNMPVLNGKEAMAIIKKDEVLRNIPLVFFTTSSSELDKMYCRRFGVEMVTKPPQYQTLRDTVRRMLDSYLTTT